MWGIAGGASSAPPDRPLYTPPMVRGTDYGDPSAPVWTGVIAPPDA